MQRAAHWRAAPASPAQRAPEPAAALLEAAQRHGGANAHATGACHNHGASPACGRTAHKSTAHRRTYHQMLGRHLQQPLLVLAVISPLGHTSCAPDCATLSIFARSAASGPLAGTHQARSAVARAATADSTPMGQWPAAGRLCAVSGPTAAAFTPHGAWAGVWPRACRRTPARTKRPPAGRSQGIGAIAEVAMMPPRRGQTPMACRAQICPAAQRLCGLCITACPSPRAPRSLTLVLRVSAHVWRGARMPTTCANPRARARAARPIFARQCDARSRS